MGKVKYTSYAVQVKEAMQDAIDASFLAVGILCKSEAVLLAPVDQGFLRQSIDYQVKEDRVLIGSYSEYSIYVEKGTGVYAEDGNGRKTPWVYYDNVRQKYFLTNGQNPQPFIGPSIDKNRDKITKIFEEELKKLGNN